VGKGKKEGKNRNVSRIGGTRDYIYRQSGHVPEKKKTFLTNGQKKERAIAGGRKEIIAYKVEGRSFILLYLQEGGLP